MAGAGSSLGSIIGTSHGELPSLSAEGGRNMDLSCFYSTQPLNLSLARPNTKDSPLKWIEEELDASDSSF